MSENNSDNCSNMENDNSDDDFEDRNTLKLHLTPKSLYTRTFEPKNSSSIHDASPHTLTENIPKKLDHLVYQDLLTSQEDKSKYVISPPLKFNAPIYQDPLFEKFNLREQVKVLCSYHTILAENLTSQARLSLNVAPLPKLINSSTDSANPLLTASDYDLDEDKGNNNADSDLTDSENREYVNRFGRIIKRKFYSENEVHDLKKSKVNEDGWIPCTSKSVGRGKKPNLDADDKTPNKSASKKNIDIMNRSGLFKEREPVKTGRLAKFAEALEQKKIKDREEKVKLEVFEKSLPNNEEFLNDDVADVDENVVRRVIPPPKLKARATKKLKEIYSELEISVHPSSPSSATKVQTDRSNNGKPQVQKKQPASLKGESSASTSFSKKSNNKMVQCPICSKDFENTAIEEHASSCGENIVETRSHNPGLPPVTCRFCDQVFLHSNSEYEKHVKFCSASSVFR